MRSFARLACVMALALGGLSAFFFIAGHDIDRPDVSDVLPPPAPPISDEENMMPTLLGMTNRLVLSQSDKCFVVSCYRNHNWNRRLTIDGTSLVLTTQAAEDLADGILKTNAELFAAMEVAAKRSRAQYPPDWNLDNDCFLGFVNDSARYGRVWRFESDLYLYGSLVALRARRMRECGQSETAARDLLRLGEMFARLSYHLENGALVLHLRSPLLPVQEELVRSAVDDVLSDATVKQVDAALVRWSVAAREAFSRETRRGVLRAATMLPKFRDGISKVVIPETCFKWPDSVDVPKWLEALADALGQGVLAFPGYRRYLFQPNRSVKGWADIVRAVEPYAYAFPATADARTFFQAFGEAHPTHIRWMRRNGCGVSMVNLYSGWPGSYRLLGSAAFAAEAYRVAIAAARFNRKNGCPPPTLDALVPEFLPVVPRDPFDAARPLGYNAEQGTLHTVGAEGAFNGKVRDPRCPCVGLRVSELKYVIRLDGQRLKGPLKRVR